ncbi:hypothetical protein LWF15_01175 [Kineosporia rhizophila]|uniref:hypothetical protein n=1 Tax=Kineosporia TaxID=49184 RepID=UPI001E435310|nr:MULTISPECIES: hypothetical protein [Kineosporia]MCE0534115.1 hypothetical protein [Kineosporia rhizophila]GLY13660.1 hypothetical protein Kisp01_06760 [Kineosporia sp. NBRC 101677]
MTNRKRRGPRRPAGRSSTVLRLLPTPVPVTLPISVFAEFEPVGNEASPVTWEGAAQGMASFGNSVLEALLDARNRLEAELVVGSVFAVFEEHVPVDVDEAQRLMLTADMVKHLIQACEQVPDPITRGFLTIAGQLGPALTRVVATEAAERMAGVTLPNWAEPVAWTLERSWRAVYKFDGAAAIGMVFGGGPRQHLIVLRTDQRSLDGGICDVTVTDAGPAREIRAALESDPSIRVRDLNQAGLLEELRMALGLAPELSRAGVPSEALANLYLVHARARGLAEALGEGEVELFGDVVMGMVLVNEAGGERVLE